MAVPLRDTIVNGVIEGLGSRLCTMHRAALMMGGRTSNSLASMRSNTTLKSLSKEKAASCSIREC